MSAKYKSPSFLLPNELNTSANPANDTGINSLYSMNFDSTTRIPNITGLGLGTSVDTFSISLWFYKSNMNYSILFSAYSGSGSYFQTGVSIELNTNGTIMFFNGAARTTTSAQYSANTWYNLVVTSDGTTVKMYVNGSQVTLDSTTAQARNFTNVWINSAAYSSNNFGITGKIDEVAIFNRALTDGTGGTVNEIAALYGGTSPNIYPSNLMATDLNPIAYYPLGEQAQNTGYLDPSNPGSDMSGSEWQFPNGVLQDYVMDFDGGSVSTLSTYSGLDGANKLTISFWVKSTSAVTSVPLSIGTSPNRQIYITIQSSGRIVFRKNENGDNTYLRADSGTPHDGNWNHILISMDLTASSRGGIYFNGNNITYQNTLDTNAIQTSTGSLLVGDSANFVGNIAQLAIWSGTDLRNDVATIYNNGSPNDLNNNGLTAPTTWWKLNADSVYTPSAPNYTTALSFNGTTDFIKLNSNTQNFTNFSLSFWCTTGGGHYKSILGSNASNEGGILKAIVVAGGSIQYSDSTNSWVNISGALSSTTWNHILITYNNTGNSLKTYKNGTLITTKNPDYSGSSTNAHSIRYIGARYNTGFFNKYISNVALFDSELTASQALTLFNFGTPETNISFNPTHWWKLDDQTAIIDYGSGGINGTNNGATDISSGVAVTPSWKIPDASGTSNGVSTTLPSTALQQSDLQFDSPYSNYSLSFDGTGDYIDFGTNPSIEINGDISISSWIYVTAGSAFQGIVTKRGTSTNYQFYTDNSAIPKLRFWDGAGVSSIGTLSLNTWHHAVVTVNSGVTNGLTFYIDGIASGTGTATIVSNTDNLTIGSISGGNFFNGNIDETSIFNYSLSEAQVLEIYNNGRPNDLTTFSGTAPISWWRLGENAYFDNNSFIVPNSITGAPNGTGSGTITTMISADAPGTYANGVGSDLDILDRVGDAPLSTSNSQSYNMIPDDKSPYVPAYVGLQTDNIYSMSFDSASSDYITATISALDNATALTFSGWFKKTINNVVGFESFVSSTDRIILYWWSDNNVYWSVRNGSASSTASSVLTIYDWNHIAGTFDGATNTIKLYINGSLVDTETGQPSSTSANLSNNFHIGLSNGNTYNNGQIDEVAIWDTALNAGQIYNDLYQPTATATATNKTADLVNNPNLPNPVAWYRMGD